VRPRRGRSSLHLCPPSQIVGPLAKPSRPHTLGTLPAMVQEHSGSPLNAAISAAWARLSNDCGCPDIYYCPVSDEIECPRHSGFTTCCDRIGEHVTVR